MAKKRWESVAKKISPLILNLWKRGYKEGRYQKPTTLKEIYNSILRSYDKFYKTVKTRQKFEWGDCGILGLIKTFVPPEYWEYAEWRNPEGRNRVWYITLDMIKKKKVGYAVEYKRVTKTESCPTCGTITKTETEWVRGKKLLEKYKEICEKLKTDTKLI